MALAYGVSSLPVGERRRHGRVSCRRRAVVQWCEGHADAEIQDVGGGGILLSLKQSIPLGTRVRISVLHSDSTVLANCSATVIRASNLASGRVEVAFSCASPLSLPFTQASTIDEGIRKPVRLNLTIHCVPWAGFLFRGLVRRDGAYEIPPPWQVAPLPRDIDVVVFPACSPVALSGSSFSWRVFRYVDRWPKFLVDLRGSLEEYMAKFSSKSRWSLKRKARKLAACGRIEYIEFRSPQEMAQFQALAGQVELGLYQRTILRNALPAGDGFLKQMTDCAQLDQARGYILLLSGKPIAFLYCEALGDSLVHLFSGYDPAFARFSPGVLLQQFAQHRFSFFDFMCGGGKHKQFFSTSYVQCADVYFFRTSARSLAAAAIHGLNARLVRSMWLLSQSLGHRKTLLDIVCHLESGLSR